ncbi:MAG: hypothetical protein ACLQG5_00930 [Methanobacterium sp.]
MDVEIKLSVNEDGNKIFIIEDENVAVQIVIKKNYSNVESKLRNLHILKDIEDVLNAVPGTDEFKELVDSYGLLYADKTDMD